MIRTFNYIYRSGRGGNGEWLGSVTVGDPLEILSLSVLAFVTHSHVTGTVDGGLKYANMPPHMAVFLAEMRVENWFLKFFQVFACIFVNCTEFVLSISFERSHALFDTRVASIAQYRTWRRGGGRCFLRACTSLQ